MDTDTNVWRHGVREPSEDEKKCVVPLCLMLQYCILGTVYVGVPLLPLIIKHHSFSIELLQIEKAIYFSAYLSGIHWKGHSNVSVLILPNFSREN